MSFSIVLALGLSLTAQTQPDPRADFVTLCVETRAQPDAVRRALTGQPGWEPAAGPDDLVIWRRDAGGHAQTLTIGRRQVGDGLKDICSIQWAPGDAALIEGAPEGLAPVTGVINAEHGLYAVAASAEAYDARDIDFVSVTHTDEMTTLILLSPVE